MKLSRGQMGGAVLKTQAVGGLHLTETLCLPHHRAPRHSHELFQFCLVREGAFTESDGRNVRECTAFSLISRPPDEIHSNIYHNKGARSFVVEIEDSWFELARKHSIVSDAPVHFKSGLPVWLAARLYDEFQNMDGVSPLMIEALTLELIAVVSRRTVKTVERRRPRCLVQALEILHAHFSTELSLRGIAESVGVHPVHLARTFRRHQHCTLGEYVRGLRVEYACRELSLTDTPLSQIALSAGYYDQSHFSRNFKRSIGVTPAEYRAAFRSR
jgi:AraC family transcriptional regulator